MPPKPRFKKEKIVDIAFAYVRANGWPGLTARYLSEKLGSSTMPIYSSFESMKHLEEEVVKRAMELCFEYITTPRTGDPWVDHGTGYALFALKEKHLFRAIFDEEHVPLREKYSRMIWENLGEVLASYPRFHDLSETQMHQLRRARWVLMHGMASLINTGAVPVEDEEQIPRWVEMGSRVLLSGIQANVE